MGRKNAYKVSTLDYTDRESEREMQVSHLHVEYFISSEMLVNLFLEEYW